MPTSLKLNEIEIGPPIAVSTMTEAEKLEKGKSVKSMGIISLVLAIFGVFIPCLGLFMLIAAFFLSRHALKISRDFLVSDDVDKYARWASVISSVFLVFSVIGTIILVLRSL